MEQENHLKIQLANLYDEHFDRLYRFFYRKCLDHHRAEELTSDTFLQLAEAISSGKDIENYKYYLYGIARNIFNQFLQRKYKFIDLDDQVLDFVETVDAEEADAGQSAFEKLVADCVKLLPNKQQRILHMRLVEKKTLDVICDILQKDMNYVKTTQKRGIKKLRQILKNHYQNVHLNLT